MKIKSYQTRAFSIEGVDKAQADNAPFMALTLSSETPVLRSFGNEILLHGVDNIDFSRATPNGLPLLVCHNDGQLPIGRIKNIRIDPATKKLRGDAYFSGQAGAQAIRQDVLDGIITDVSVGYRIMGHRVERAARKGDLTSVFVTRWQPREGSVVADGADPAAGFGRGREDDEEIDLDVDGEPKADTEEETPATETPATTEEPATETPAEETPGVEPTATTEEPSTEEVPPTTETPATETPTETEEVVVVVTEEEPAEDEDQEEKRAAGELLHGEELQALRSVAISLKFRTASEVDRILSEAPDLSAARAQILKPPTTATTYTQGPTMITNELIVRSMRKALNGDFNLDEAVAPIFVQTGQRSFTADLFDTRGLLADAMATRANEMTTTGKGAAAVYETNIGFLEILRARTAVLKAGARTRTGSGAMSYMRQKAAVVATLRGENTGAVGNTYADFEKVPYTPKALVAKVFLTDELQKESIQDLQNVLRNDMTKQFGVAMDNYALNGAASPAITGILSAGVGVYNGDLGAAALPTWATVNNLKGLVDQKAVDLESCAYLLTPSLLALLETTPKFANGSVAIAEGNKINGYAAYSSANVPVNALNHTAVFGDFSNLEIALMGPTEFSIDTQSRFDEGITILTARQYFDVGCLQGSAFAKCANFKVA